MPRRWTPTRRPSSEPKLGVRDETTVLLIAAQDISGRRFAPCKTSAVGRPRAGSSAYNRSLPCRGSAELGRVQRKPPDRGCPRRPAAGRRRARGSSPTSTRCKFGAMPWTKGPRRRQGRGDRSAPRMMVRASRQPTRSALTPRAGSLPVRQKASPEMQQALRRPITLVLAGALLLQLALAALPTFAADADLFRAWGLIIARSGPDDLYHTSLFLLRARGTWRTSLWLLGGLNDTASSGLSVIASGTTRSSCLRSPPTSARPTCSTASSRASDRAGESVRRLCPIWSSRDAHESGQDLGGQNDPASWPSSSC